MKAHLTAAFCASAACEAGKRKTDYWDLSITGFVLETRSSGGKTYYLRYFDPVGRQRQLKIGSHKDISFAEAQKAAKRFRADVVLDGDPVGRKQERKAIPTYAVLSEQHVAEAKRSQRSWWSTEGIIRRHLLPRWGKLRLDEIKTQDVAAWLGTKTAEGLKPATIEKIRVVFGRSFELAKRWEIAGAETNPVRGIARPRFNNARQRYLTADEAQRLRLACERSPNPQLKHIVGLLLLTGARKSELLKAKWPDVDLDRRAWFIPDTKTGKPRHVPLSGAAAEIIEQLPRFDRCPYLLPNPETKKPYDTFKRAWDTAREEAGLPGLRIHDLRHSAASFMINAGVDLYAVGRVLGHADHQSTQRYAHLANETLLRAVEAGAAGLKAGWADKAP